MRHFVKYWLPVILWCAFIFATSTDAFSAFNTYFFFKPLVLWIFPGASLDFAEKAHFFVRKLGHFSDYFILAFLLMHALKGEEPENWKWRWAIVTLLVVWIYALGDEIHQAFVPSRTPLLKDVWLDFIGGSCSISCLYVSSKLKMREGLKHLTAG